MADQWQTFLHLLTDLGTLLLAFAQFAMRWLLLIAWIAWWLGGANWKKIWPVLAQGAWAPVVLLCVLAALVWSQVLPGEWPGKESALRDLILIPNFWWQLGAVGLIAGTALFCGWLQGVFQWTPQEVSVDPPAPSGHGHGHGHEHD